MNISVLDIGTLGDDLNFEAVKNLGNVTFYDITLQNDVIERIKDADVLILNKVKLNKENLPYAKNLKLICVTATGFDNVDIDYCRENNIAVCNVAGYSTDSVVQLTVAMVFSLATHLGEYDNYVKSATTQLTFEACNMAGNAGRRIQLNHEAINLLLQATMIDPENVYPWIHLAWAFKNLQLHEQMQFCIKHAAKYNLDAWSKKQLTLLLQ